MSRSVVVHAVDSVTAEDLAACDAQLSAVTAELGALFTRPEPKETFCLLVRGMLAEVAKKNCCCDTRSHVLSELVEEDRRMSKT
jgi:hypothetical protein